ncbi:D-amino-acid dehydrogenase [Paraburkholderia sp. BL6665CI2N2]|uniref:NAD(P)/FAD-dependent oxidoreductase n=1 Tax=Paraburkholderia sp. BL6665CI2N2 TaxID=1938806 RepID=UPI00106507FC|nr:FAD-binding oxidoreductase [Paraburkholderia sp. BL6665CI2N2]TDY17093.1 D-amino-acid dehydrogenase [Paraburkholderia sp. BL6665CI2N2]
MIDTVVVIGGGVAGLSAARSLQLAGRQVAVIDPMPSTGGASYGNGGFITPDSFMPGAQPGMLRKVPGWLLDPLGPLAISPQYAPHAIPWFLRWLREGRGSRMTELAHMMRKLNAPALTEWRRLVGDQLYGRYIRENGQVYLSDTPSTGSAAEIEQRMTIEYGLDVEPLFPEKIQTLYPGISSSVKFGVLKRGNGHTNSPGALNDALAEKILEAGGVFHRESVLKLIPESDQWLVLTSSGNHRARDIVVAAGVWSMQLLRPLGISIPLESQRGYHVMIQASNVEIGIPFIHRGRGVGLTPMIDGLRVAGSVEFSGVDGMPNEQRALQLVRHAQQLFPALTEAPHKIWTGQRPSTPDSLPVIGAAGERPGLWLCFGHGTYGMTAAPPSGRLLAELVTGVQPFTDPVPYSPRRFT